MPCGCNRIFAVVIIPCFLVLAVCLGDIAVHTLAAAWAFQDTGQDVCVVWIVDLFPLKGLDFENGKAEVILLADWDTVKTNKFASRAIAYLLNCENEKLPKEIMVVFE